MHSHALIFIQDLAVIMLIAWLATSILPPLELLFLIMIFTGILIAFVWPWFIKLHSKLQISLMESIGNKK